MAIDRIIPFRVGIIIMTFKFQIFRITSTVDWSYLKQHTSVTRQLFTTILVFIEGLTLIIFVILLLFQISFSFVNPLPNIFGGYTSNNYYDNLIARLDGVTFSWSQMGEMIQGRYGHNAIVVQGEILVVGGQSGSLKTERCNEIEGQMRCNAQEPELNKYYYYPELFAVPDNFCI